MDKKYRIAGIVVQMDCGGRTESQALPYQVSQKKDAVFTVSPDLEEVRKLLPDLPDEGVEYLATGKSFFSKLLNYDGLMLHSSALIMNGRAYLFSADPGTGKSTHVCNWRRVFGDDRVRVLNDDKPALRLEDGVWYAYGTPWSGKTGQNLNLRAPVAGITMIERGEFNEIEPFTGRKAVQAILAQTTTVKDVSLKIKQLDLLDKLMTQVPIWKLKCNMEPEAAIVAYEAMSGEQWRK